MRNLSGCLIALLLLTGCNSEQPAAERGDSGPARTSPSAAPPAPALSSEQLAAMAPSAAPFSNAMSNVESDKPTVETTVNAPLKFQRYANQAQG